MESSSTRFENHLGQFTENQWLETLSRLLPEIHEVDRNATQIWFRFYPLSLFRYLENTEDIDATLHGFAMQGAYALKDHIDTSANFLWGHRFWADVKRAITERTKSFESTTLDLANEIRAVAKSVAHGAGRDTSLLVGITAVGFMTLAQTDLEAFSKSGGQTKPSGLLAKEPDKVARTRLKKPSGGLFGFLKTINKNFKVTWDETESNANFVAIQDQEIASASAKDQTQDWKARDERAQEGVIPVECRAAACGTCWIGVIGGAENLSDVQDLERKQMRVFGYKQGDEAKPIMRLACQARVEGSVSVVIPPWNGVFGKKLYGVEQLKLEPATTSARKLRETIEDATGSLEN